MSDRLTTGRAQVGRPARPPRAGRGARRSPLPAAPLPDAPSLAAMVVLCAVVGAVAGLLVWAFLFAMDLSLSVIWGWLPQVTGASWLPLLVCPLGGVIVGLSQLWIGAEVPQPLETVMEQVKETSRYPYDHMGKRLVCAFLPLAFGGVVGPEAGLTGVIAGLCTWAGDRMRMAKSSLSELVTSTVPAVLGAVFNAPLFAFVAPVDEQLGDVERVTFVGRRKAIMNAIAIASSLGVFLLLKSIGGTSGGIWRFSAASFGPTEAIWTVPLLAAGIGLGLFYQLSMKATARLGAVLAGHPVVRAVLTGIVVGAVGMLLPLVMFSGEEQLGVIASQPGAIAASVLIASGVVKLCVGPLCLNGGWRGGSIFPIIFSGAAVGLGIAVLVGADATFACAVVCGTLCGVVMRKPLSVVMLLVLCFPVVTLPFVAVGAVAGASVPAPFAGRHDRGPDGDGR